VCAHTFRQGTTNACWTLCACPSFQRLNVCEGAPVDAAFMATLTPVPDAPAPVIGEGHVAAFRAAHAVELRRCRCTVWRGRVRHHLRGGNANSHHHEIWRVLLVEAPDAPLDSQTSHTPSSASSHSHDPRDPHEPRGTRAEPGRRSLGHWMTSRLTAATSTAARSTAPPSTAAPSQVARARVWVWPVGRDSDFENVGTMDMDVPVSVTALPTATGTGLAAALATIVRLDLSNTGMTRMPSDTILWQLAPTLRRLECHCNALTTVPDAIGALLSLDYLALHSNALVEVSPRLGDLVRLRWLSLHATGSSWSPACRRRWSASRCTPTCWTTCRATSRCARAWWRCRCSTTASCT
jgi:hypothetical protein